MSTDDQFDDDPFGDSEDSPKTGSVPPPKKKGMSTLVKVLIFLGCSTVGLGIVCCGGLVWWGSSMAPTEDPIQVAARSKKILDLEIPDMFKPQMAMTMNMIVMKVEIAVYMTDSQQGMLMLMSLDMPNAGPQQQKDIRKSMQQQKGQGRLLTIDSTEKKKFMVRGNEVEFKFAKATEDNTDIKYRQVSSSFAGPAGTTMLILEIPEDEYDEEAIIKMIESIK